MKKSKFSEEQIAYALRQRSSALTHDDRVYGARLGT